MTAPSPGRAELASAIPVMHFYCTDDTTYTAPICGATKPGNEQGTDCPLCGLIFDEIDAGLRVCPFCLDDHWVAV